MRDRFGDWGAGLSDAEFACALAAGGLLRPWVDPRWPPEILAEQIREQLHGRAAVWIFSELMLRFDARTLARAWKRLRETVPYGIIPVVIDFSSLHREGIHPQWLTAQLVRDEVGAASVNIGLESTPPSRSLPAKELSYSVEDSDRGYRSPPPAPTMRESGLRFLQARLLSRRDRHQVDVRIGVPDRGWMSVDKPFPVPRERPEPKGYRLTVIFWEPRACPEPRVETLWLPKTGNSVPVSFPLPEGVTSIEARITVLHNNRVLQTGVLRAALGGNEPASFRLDAMPRTRLEGLAARSEFDAALVLNHDGDGTPRLTASSDGQAVVLALDAGATEKLTRILGAKISAIADHPARFKGLGSPGSVELLRELAQKGAVLHDHLCKHTGLARLADARRIHITSARAETFFPAELLYRFRPPSDTATLCPHALKALKTGDCTSECASDKREAVCPLGFWGLSKVIERHAHTPEDHDRIARDFELRPEPVRERSPLSIAGGALLAASGKVSTFKKDAVTRLLARLKKRGHAMLANTWREWETFVGNGKPRLLILLPHHDKNDEGEEFLEIGQSERLEIDQIWDETVRYMPNGPNPVVLLMGCETNLTEISFENPVTRFRDHGAAVVVSTIATILGRHASPATESLVHLLDKMADGKHSFGDIMLRLRQQLVATSTPMALGLTSYGDADWILTREKG